MKKLLIAAVAAVTFLLGACTTDFEVTGPWKNIPVVYGILSVTDTAQYIRVEKAFLDPERNALEIAQIADSLYYPENQVNAYLQVSGGPRIALQRVDGNLEGYVRSGGIFANSPNWLYKLPPGALAVEPGKTYQFLLERTDGDTLATSATTVPGAFRFRQPLTTVSVIRVSFLPGTDTRFEWSSDANAEFFTLRAYVRIREVDNNGNLLEEKNLTWTIAERAERSQTPSITPGQFNTSIAVSGVSFYQFLNNNLEPTNTRRRIIQRLTLELQGGGQGLGALYEGLSANAGLTGAEFIPTFSNIAGGYGLFTSKNTLAQPDIFLTDLTIDSLQIHPLTRELNFE